MWHASTGFLSVKLGSTNCIFCTAKKFAKYKQEKLVFYSYLINISKFTHFLGQRFRPRNSTTGDILSKGNQIKAENTIFVAD